MDVSHPVRRMHEGPVECRLPFGGLRVRVPQEKVDPVCSVPGLAPVGTDSTAGI